jgi:hypothetical protein
MFRLFFNVADVGELQRTDHAYLQHVVAVRYCNYRLALEQWTKEESSRTRQEACGKASRTLRCSERMTGKLSPIELLGSTKC